MSYDHLREQKRRGGGRITGQMSNASGDLVCHLQRCHIVVDVVEGHLHGIAENVYMHIYCRSIQPVFRA